MGLTQSAIRRTEAHFVSPSGDQLFRRAWLPPDPLRSVVLVHGYGEHSGRYEYVGSRLAEAGCAVAAYDQRGHGRSPGARGHVRRFSDLLDDLETFVALIRSERPTLPLFVVGHSMGGLVVAAYACERSPQVAGAATSGAALALSDGMSRGRIWAARLLRTLAPGLSMSSGLDVESLSKDPAVVRAYLDDPLVHQRMTLSLASEMLAAVKRTAGAGSHVAIPMLIMHGEDDRLCPPSGSLAFYDQLAGSSKRLRTYPGLRHEIFNEPERDQVLGDLVDWISSLDREPESPEAR